MDGFYLSPEISEFSTKELKRILKEEKVDLKLNKEQLNEKKDYIEAIEEDIAWNMHNIKVIQDELKRRGVHD